MAAGLEIRSVYTAPRRGDVIRGASSSAAAPGRSHGEAAGGSRRGMPASWNRRSMSDGQNSKTWCRVNALASQATRPVRVSIRTGRCSVLTRIGDLPGMNQVSLRSRQCSLGRSPLDAQTSTRARPAGAPRTGAPRSRPCSRRLSTIWKNRGAAAFTPMKAGLPLPSKFPIHTAST